jgi:hypothetical protein
MTRQQRLHERNQKVRLLFNKLSSSNPKWRVDAVIEDVANKCFLSPRTVEAIISYEGIYGATIQPKQDNQLKMF